MSVQFQFRRGNTTQNNSFTGVIAEISIDTSTNTIRVHDAITAGGTKIMPTLSLTNAQRLAFTPQAGQLIFVTNYVSEGVSPTWMGDGSSIGGIIAAGSVVASASTATNLTGGTNGQIPFQTAPGVTSFFGPGSAGNVLVSYGSSASPVFQNTLTLAGTTAASSTTTGALVVGGGVGVGGNLYVGGEIVANKLTIQLTTVTTTLVQTDDIIQTLNVTQSSSTTTGALQVAGGAGIGLDITVGGSIRVASVVTATTFIGNLTGNITGNGTGNLHYQSANNTTSFLSTGTTGQLLVAAGGSPVWTTTSSIQVGYAANILGLGTGGILYESADNTTSILSTATTGNFLQANYNGAPTWTTTASMYVARAVMADISAGGANTATNIYGGNAWQIPYQSAPSTTLFASSGTTGQFWQAATNGAPTWTSTSSIYVNSAVSAEKLYAGTAGQIVYQSAADTTGFVSTATTGNFLQANYAGAPTWTTTASMYVNDAVKSTNLRAGTAGQLPYQSAVDTSGFISTATTGNFLQANYVGAPTWTTTASIYVNSSVASEKLYAGTAGQIVYQSAVSTTAFLGTATTGNFLQANYVGAPTWTTTANIYVANAAIATNVRAGTAGQLVYQSAVDTSGFISTATTGNFLQANYVGAPTWTTTASMYVARAVIADSASGGSAQVNTVAQTASASYYPTFVSTNNASASAMSVYTTSSFTINPATGNISVAGTAGSNNATSGALQIVGGVGVGGSMYVGGVVTATTFFGNLTGTATGANTATNLFGGNAWQIPYQSAPSTTLFASSGTTGQFWQATTNGAPAWTSTANIYVADAAIATNVRAGTAWQIPYQSAASTTLFASSGTTGQFWQAATNGAPTWTTTANIYVANAAIATNVRAGTAGQLVYQSAADTSGFISTATTGNFLQANFVGAPTWTTTASMYVNDAVKSTNLRGGILGSLPYQSAADTTTFLGIGTVGYVLTSNGSSPTWSALSGLTSGSATTATNLANGTAGQLPYQTAVGLTSFVSTATTGNFLQANYVGAPTWTTTANIYVANAAIATNVRAGTAGQLVYQSAADTSGFISTATTGNFLQANFVGAPTWTTTASMYVANAVTANNLAGGSAGQFAYQTGPGATSFISTGSMYVGNSAKVDTAAQTANASYYPTFVDANNAAAGTESVYTTSSFLINPSTGLISLAGRLAVNNADASTTTNTSNALYVAGGAWINKNLTVAGDTTFQGSVVFNGTNTFVYSSSTVYTDNLISLHSPSGSGPGNHTWTIDDGKDIGFMFHYYKTTDKDAFLGFANDTSYLEWYDNGIESGGVFTGTSYGTFKTGAIKLVGGTANTGNTSSGDLTVLGGVGIGNNLYVAGNITVAGTINASITGVATTASNIANGTAGQLVYQSAPGATSFVSTATTGNFLQANYVGAPTWTTTANIYVNRATIADSATAATNLSGGNAWQIPYQTAPSTTAFANSGTTGQFWQATTNGAPTWTTTANIYVANAAIATNVRAGTAGQLVYQSAVDTSGFISTATTGNFLQANYVGAPTWTSTGSMYVNRAVIADSATGGSNTATNIYGGNAWQIPYQSAPSTTLFASSGTTGQFWQATTNGAPAWTTTANIYVANAAIATNVRAGTAGQLHYQSAADTTAFLGTATTGNFLQANYVGAPTWTSTGSMYVNRAVIADSASGGSATATNLSGGNAWQIPYQSAPSTTLFASSGTTGQFWQATTNGAPAWTTTANIYVANAQIATHQRGGTAGQLQYQSAADTTAFVSTATTGNFLQANYVGAPTWTSTGSMYVNRAVIADSASGGSSQVNTVAQTASANYFPTFVSTNNASAAAMSVYTTSSFTINPATGNVGFGITPAYKLHVTATTNVICQMDGSVGGSRLEISNYGTSLYLGDHGVNNSIVFDTPQNFIRFLTNSGNERLRITSGGGISFGAGGTAYGTTGQVLQSNGNASPTWVAVGSVTAGTSTQVQTVLQTASANYYPTFVDSNNATATAESVYTTSSFVINPATGNVGVGTTSPTAKLHVSGNTIISGNAVIGATTTTNKFEVVGTAGQLFSVSDTFTGTVFAASDISGIPSIEVLDTGLVKLAQYNGSVAISTGTAVSGSGLAVWTSTYILSLGVGTSGSGTIGEIRATNEVTAYYSDRRLKENVQVIDNALVKVLSLNGITYTPNAIAESYGYDRTKKLVGVFADEIEAVLPEAVRPAPFDIDESGGSKSGENYKTVQYEKIVPLLIEAIKEQQHTIDVLRSELETVKNLVTKGN